MFILLILYVDGVSLCLRTAATNGPIVQPQIIYECGEPRWNDINVVKLKK
jgi:hypothetical protein